MLSRNSSLAITSLTRRLSSVSIHKNAASRNSIQPILSPPQTNITIANVPNLVLTFRPREISLDIGHTRINPFIPRKEITDIPLISRIIENPNANRISEINESPASITSMDLPMDSNKVGDGGIQAARLIVIRRRKMRKHKLKKLRKKMKFEWAKVRQRREMRKEKAFQAELIMQIKEAEKFSAEVYVAEKLRRATETPIPRFWKGKRLPQFIIKQKLGIE
ncbi:uncharacterized protein LOC129775691 [Toxorhynchites rutilus septentrionalis]|uniref:uncharacterized protein LOC129775691 n=1 Tax=Toxorhynchites rutilus septentrionalis TaxID=329112 RepID=UPI00247A899F|nr:uncharacterized protein LOC129775691 [Toxorhynchites rutilus septentrionalis]